MLNKQLIIILVLVIVLSGSYFHMLKIQDVKNAIIIKEYEKKEIISQKIKSIFGNMSILAKSALVVDTTNKRVLYDRHSSETMPLASITKIMTAIVALENLNPKIKIKITNESLSEKGDDGLLSGEMWGRDDLIKFTLVTSSNDGARALAMQIPNFVYKMNVKANELRMTKTTFYNPTGLDISKTQSGAVGTAKDVATMMNYAITKYPEIFKNTTMTKRHFKSNKKNHEAINTNHFLSLFPNITASKTGLTNLAGGNLAIAFEPIYGDTIIAVVMGSSYEGRFLDMEQLAKSSKEIVNSL